MVLDRAYKTASLDNKSLWQHQIHALSAIEKAISECEQNITVKMPTGSGKSEIIKRLFEKYKSTHQVIIVSSRRLLVEQLGGDLGDEAGIHYSGRKTIGNNDSVVTTYNSLDTAVSKFSTSNKPVLLILDESHNAGSDERQRIIHQLKERGATRINFSATPDQNDGRVVYNLEIEDAVKQGIIHSFRVVIAKFKVESQSEHNDSQNIREDLPRIAVTRAFFDKVADVYIEFVQQNHKKTIAFVSNVARAEQFAELFCSKGVKAGSIHSGMTPAEIEAVLLQLANGDIEILFNVDMLTEGYNLPDIDCVLNIDPTSSARRETQRVGRGLRLSKNNPNPKLILEVAIESEKDSKLPVFFPQIVGAASVNYSYPTQRSTEPNHQFEKEQEYFEQPNLDLHGIKLIVNPVEVMQFITKRVQERSEKPWTLAQISRAAGYSDDAVSTNETHLNLIQKWAEQYSHLKGVTTDTVYQRSDDARNQPSKIDPEFGQSAAMSLKYIKDNYTSLSAMGIQLGYDYPDGGSRYFVPKIRAQILNKIIDTFITDNTSEECFETPHIIEYGVYIESSTKPSSRVFSPELTKLIIDTFTRLDTYMTQANIAISNGMNAKFFSKTKDNGWESILDLISDIVDSKNDVLLASYEMSNNKRYNPDVSLIFRTIFQDYISLSTGSEDIFGYSTSTPVVRAFETYLKLPGVIDRIAECVIESRKQLHDKFDELHRTIYNIAGLELILKESGGSNIDGKTVIYSRAGLKALKQISDELESQPSHEDVAKMTCKSKEEIKIELESLVLEFENAGYEIPFGGWSYNLMTGRGSTSREITRYNPLVIDEYFRRNGVKVEA